MLRNDRIRDSRLRSRPPPDGRDLVGRGRRRRRGCHLRLSRLRAQVQISHLPHCSPPGVRWSVHDRARHSPDAPRSGRICRTSSRPARRRASRARGRRCSASSFASDEQTRTPAPLVRRAGDEREDRGLGADVDALGRLVQQQHLRVVAQPLGEHDLLLVAAAEKRRAARRARRAGRRRARSSARPRRFSAPPSSRPNTRAQRLQPSAASCSRARSSSSRRPARAGRRARSADARGRSTCADCGPSRSCPRRRATLDRRRRSRRTGSRRSPRGPTRARR